MLRFSTNIICAVIPFYNEIRTLRKVTQATLNYVDLVIAVDDGSTDGSADSIRGLENVVLIRHIENLGKGAALKSGFLKSIEIESKVTLTIDSDMQHPPECIPDFLRNAGSFDIIIGNRLNNKGKMPLQRILSNTLTSMLMTLKTGQKIEDSQCGFRLFRTGILKDILTISSGYEAESEILVNAARLGYKIGFLEIPAVYSDEISKMNPFQAIYGFLKVIMK